MHAKRIATVTLCLAAAAAVLALPAWLSAGQSGAAPGSEIETTAPERGYLGVSVRSLTPELRRHFGAPDSAGLLVAAVTADGPAAAAGIEVGDVLISVAGREIASSGELIGAVRPRAGETVPIELYREGTAVRIEATLGARPDSLHHARVGWHGDAEGWQEWAEHWQRWGEEMGEKWGRIGEEMGEKWGQRGEEWGEKWGRIGEEMGEKWGEEWGEKWGRHGEEMGELGIEMGEFGVDMGELGARIGLEVARAMEEMDWDRLSADVEESMKALDEVDWEEISRQVERSLERADEQIERSLERMERELERAERERERARKD